MSKYIAAAFVFGVIAVVTGYFTTTENLSLPFWLDHQRAAALWWFLGGCGIGVGLRYAFTSQRS